MFFIKLFNKYFNLNLKSVCIYHILYKCSQMVLKQTQDILGLDRLVHFDVFSFALAVNSKDSEEVVVSGFQVRHHILAGLNLFVDGHPFFFFCVHLIQNIVCDFTAAIIDRLLPSKGDGGLCGVNHMQLGWFPRQI